MNLHNFRYKLEWEVFSRTPIISYTLRFREINSQDNFQPGQWRVINIDPVEDADSVHKQSFELDNLSMDNSYEVDLEAENKFGKTRSDIFTFNSPGLLTSNQ